MIKPTAALAAAAIVAVQVALPVAVAAQGTQQETDTARAYCGNLADAAADARYARKLSNLREMEARIEDRLAALERKRAEYEDWLKKRERFLSIADDGLVAIYTAMRADAASEQLAAMDEVTAASVIAKVQPRTASAILNEMETDKAARLATIVAAMSQEEQQKS